MGMRHKWYPYSSFCNEYLFFITKCTPDVVVMLILIAISIQMSQVLYNIYVCIRTLLYLFIWLYTYYEYPINLVIFLGL